MSASLDPHLFLAVGSPYVAAVQLLYKLPGQYRLTRHQHHSYVVNRTNLIYRDLISPSHCISTITLRPPLDSYYEMELLQMTSVNLCTTSGDSATIEEKRAFRIKNGQWSLWRVDQFNVVGEKLADLTMEEVRAPQRVGPLETDVVQKVMLFGGPWRDRFGNHSVEILIQLGRSLRWEQVEVVDRPKITGKGRELCEDEMWPIVDAGGGS